MQCPQSLPADDEMYDLAPGGAAPEKPAPAVAAGPPPGASPTLSYRTPPALDPGVQDRGVDPDLLKKRYAPLWILCGGLVVEIVSEYFQHAGNLQGALMDIGIGLIAGTIIMLAGVMFAAKVRQIDIGSFGSAALRLAAVSVAPGAVVTLLQPLAHIFCFGWIILLGIQFLLYFALLGALFDLDESDTWFCVITIFVINLGVYALMLWIASR